CSPPRFLRPGAQQTGLASQQKDAKICLFPLLQEWKHPKTTQRWLASDGALSQKSLLNSCHVHIALVAPNLRQ
ncbi:hypothetical protein LEMLEM_LOCUS18929, partial [Lemmus lemmus]